MKRQFSLILILSVLLIGCKEECKELDFSKFNWNGCGNFMVYDTLNVNGIENCYLTIQVERDELNLNSDFISFEIQDNEYIKSEITQFNLPRNSFCKDYGDSELEIINLWNLKSGTVEIRLVHDKNECNSEYVVDVIIRQGLFMDSLGIEIFVRDKEILNVIVGFKLG